MTSIIMIEDVTIRRREIMKIMTHLRKNGQQVNRYTVKEQLNKLGFETSASTIYRDMTAINRENTWVRDLAESNYSTYQEDISNTFDWLEMKASERFEFTHDHVWLSIILKVQDSRIKHTSGENINISAALLGKKFKKFEDGKQPIAPLQEESSDDEISAQKVVDVIKLCKQQQRQKDEECTP